MPGTDNRNASANFTRRRRSLDGICLAVESLRAHRIDKETGWTPCFDDDSFGPKLRIAILKECLRSSKRRPGSWSVDSCSKKIFDKLESPPIRKSGPRRLNDEEVSTGGFRWDAKSIRNFLDLKNSPPEQHGIRLADCYAEVVAEAISSNPQTVAVAIKSALSSARLIEDAVEAIMAHAQVTAKPRAFAVAPSWISSSFQTPPNRASAAHFLPAAEAAWKFLSSPGDGRIFFVRGDPYSGKKTVLKHFVEMAEKGVPVGDEIIPLFAASLADLTSAELIEQLYKFYLKLPANAALRSDIAPHADEDWKLDRIRLMANRQPACVLLADTDQSESDHTFGSISQDRSAKIVAALAQGHPDTRLLITAATSAKRGRLHREALLYGAHVEYFNLKGHFPLAEVVDQPTPDQADKSIDGKTWKFALITKDISRAKWGSGNAGLNLERERCIMDRDTEGLATLVWRALLSPLERALLGLISISHDGVRSSVLLKLVAGLGEGRTPLPDLPKLSESAIAKALGAVGELLHKRQFQAEPALVRAGYLGAEPIYWLDQDWRLLFLRLWWNDDPARARLAHWLVAREAAAQSRRLRVHDLDTPATLSFGRDIQTLHALIASIDPDAVVGPQDRDVGPLFNLEGRVLPALEHRTAAYPDPTVVLRYCFLNLYHRDIEGKDDYRLLTIEENAHARLSILLPLFTPSSPWLVPSERKLENDLDKHGHLKRAFAPAELVDLLASVAIAAERLRRYDLIAACAELGRQIVAEAGVGAVNVVNYMRLLRSQIDAHLFLGRKNATSTPSMKRYGGWLYSVAHQIEELLSHDFAPTEGRGRERQEMATARGKLFARLGEANHVLGRSYRARVAFARASEAEEAALRMQPVGTTLAPVLGGRGARRHIRFLLEQGRRRSSSRRLQHFIFPDGVALPAPIKVRPGAPEYRSAEALHDVNARRSQRGRAEDAVGLKIDAARLAVARHEFAAALEYLDLADASVKLTSGISAELLLEFYAVRARFLLDACIFCLIANSSGPAFDSRPQLLELVRYLGMPLDSEPISVAEHLVGLTRTIKKRFDGAIDTLSDAYFPYATYNRYLGGMLAVAETRVEFGADERLSKLKDARLLLSGAVEHMRATDYRMHLHEALRVLQGVDAAWAHHTTDGAGG